MEARRVKKMNIVTRVMLDEVCGGCWEGNTLYQERVWILHFAWEIESIFYIFWAFQFSHQRHGGFGWEKSCPRQSVA
jgi:hypothetical protein